MSFFFKLSLFKSPEFSIQFSQRCFIHSSLVFHPHIHSFRMVKSRAGESLLSFQTLGKGSHHDLQRPGYAWLPRGLNIFGETYVGKKLSNSQVTWWYEWDIDTCYKLYDFFGRLYSIFKDSTLPIGLYVYIYIHISGWWLTYPLKNMLVSWDDSSQYMESHKIHVPNHQAVYIMARRYLSLFLVDVVSLFFPMFPHVSKKTPWLYMYIILIAEFTNKTMMNSPRDPDLQAKRWECKGPRYGWVSRDIRDILWTFYGILVTIMFVGIYGSSMDILWMFVVDIFAGGIKNNL